MDATREIDIRQLHEARERSTSSRERETIERAMYNIEKQSRDPRIAHAREELINAHRNHAVDDANRIEEQIREMEK